MISFDEFIDLMAPNFDDDGHMVDQAWQPRLTEGMIRCYLVCKINVSSVAPFPALAIDPLVTAVMKRLDRPKAGPPLRLGGVGGTAEKDQ